MLASTVQISNTHRLTTQHPDTHQTALSHGAPKDAQEQARYAIAVRSGLKKTTARTPYPETGAAVPSGPNSVRQKKLVMFHP